MIQSQYTPGEEALNRLTHWLGILASIIAIPWLAWAGYRGGDPWRLTGGVIFGVSALLLFVTSVRYHSATDPVVRLKRRRLDHCAIYLLIAGTYTPFTLGVLHGAWGWTLFGVTWGLAVLGILAKTTDYGFRFHKTSVLLYLVMGWIVIVAMRPLIESLNHFQLSWLIAGGVAYTLGVPFYLWKGRRYTHAIWHAFVLMGVACHFVVVLSVMAPG